MTIEIKQQNSRSAFRTGSRKENFIQKFIRTRKIKEEQKTRKQLNFLFQQVFQWYYDSEPLHLSEVDLPEFMYDKERRNKAERKAFEELLYRVADKKVVNKLSQYRARQLKQQGIKISF